MKSLNRENQAAPIPADCNVLPLCRCRDCHHLLPDARGWHCTEGIGGAAIRWSDGRQEIDPPIDAWHYCLCYDGPRKATDRFVWPRSVAMAPQDLPQPKGRPVACDSWWRDDDELVLPKRLRAAAPQHHTKNTRKLPEITKV